MLSWLKILQSERGRFVSFVYLNVCLHKRMRRCYCCCEQAAAAGWLAGCCAEMWEGLSQPASGGMGDREQESANNRRGGAVDASQKIIQDQVCISEDGHLVLDILKH